MRTLIKASAAVIRIFSYTRLAVPGNIQPVSLDHWQIISHLFPHSDLTVSEFMCFFLLRDSCYNFGATSEKIEIGSLALCSVYRVFRITLVHLQCLLTPLKIFFFCFSCIWSALSSHTGPWPQGKKFHFNQM